jgi:maleate isomerase
MASPVPDGPTAEQGIGVVVPYDMALDRELWRWTPSDVTLFFTRTPYAPMPVTIEMAEYVGDVETVVRSVQDLAAVTPAAYAYGCTSGSFVNGLAGERRLTDAMRVRGDAPAVTTSGALLEAVAGLGATRVGLATPYEPGMTRRFEEFLAEGGVEVVASAHLGLTSGIWEVPYRRTAALIREADHDRAEAVVVSCTNLPSYDLIAPLEAELGKPVITANQATMWAVLRAVDRSIVAPGQRLCTVASAPAGAPRDQTSRDPNVRFS